MGPCSTATAYSIQPATSPVAGEWSTAGGGTEYALSALDFAGGLDNRVARWALTNTSSLTGAHPAVRLTKTVLASEVYGMPPMVQQRRGPYPLGQSEKAKLNLLNSNDDRMNQVVYSGGRLWGGVNTVVKTHNGSTTVGIAYSVVRAADASMANQGYVAANRNSVMFPAIGVGAGGANPAMVFTLAGPGFYPSTAYVRLTSGGSLTGPVTVYGPGTRPADGSSGYPAEGGDGIERWGDYSAAVAEPNGTVWLATEYIPGTFGFIPGSRVPPSYLANWERPSAGSPAPTDPPAGPAVSPTERPDDDHLQVRGHELCGDVRHTKVSSSRPKLTGMASGRWRSQYTTSHNLLVRPVGSAHEVGTARTLVTTLHSRRATACPHHNGSLLRKEKAAARQSATAYPARTSAPTGAVRLLPGASTTAAAAPLGVHAPNPG